MGKFDYVGQLMHLPLESLQSSEMSSESEFVVTAAAARLQETDGRNWIPVIVKEVGDYQYEVVSNHFIFAVAQHADLEKVWCIIIQPDDEIIDQTQFLAREKTPRINLATASRDMIFAALRHLASSPENPLKGVDLTVAVNRIESADRSTWQDFSPIPKLKCGITKGKKLDALNSVFFIDAPPPPPAPPEIISIKQASHEEILERLKYLTDYRIGGFDKFEPETIADIIFAAPKTKWKSLNPLTKLDCGFETSHIKVLKTVFSL